MLAPEHQRELLALAREAVHERLRNGAVVAPPVRAWTDPLGRPGASFVTLTLDGALRGCCGSIEAQLPLAEDVWCNAQRSACDDPRFPPLDPDGGRACELSISVLGQLEPLPVRDEADLLARLRPGVDGLLMALAGRRATFLPKVWEKLPEPADFVRHLKLKMGIPARHWDPALSFHRYTAEEIGPVPGAG